MTRNPYIILLFLCGVGLTVVSTWIPLTYLYKNIFWTKTEALIIGVERLDFEDAYYVMEFTDTKGTVHQIKEYYENDFTQGKDEKHALVLYNPENPAQNEVKNPGKFFIAIFLPFGLLCSYLAWPRKDQDSPAKKNEV